MSFDFLPWVHWARPLWLWALLALPLIALWGWWSGRRTVDWQSQVDPHLLPHLLEPGAKPGRGWPWALLAGWLLVVLALAGPGWQQQTVPMVKPKAPLVVVLDLSSRIGTADLPPSRLLQARAKLAQLLQERQGGQLALVVYADDAFTVAPLTDDVANVALYLDALSPEVMPADGQRADRALGWATQLLQRSGARSGRILLLTDQADRAAIDAAAQALAQGMRVSVLGLGTPDGGAYRDLQGQIASAALDEASLRQLAQAGGGVYRRLQSGAADLQALDVLQAEGPATQDGQAKAQQWRDQGFWLLPALMLLALLAFRRRSAGLLMLVVLVGMPLAPAHAAPPGAGAPAQGTFWKRADQRQQEQLAQGVQAYRAGDYRSAQRYFSGIDSSEGWYNLGNVRARQGDLDGAIQAYDRALSLQPGMADAVANRQVVDAARKRKANQQNQSNQGQQGSQGKQDGKPPSAGQNPQGQQGQDNGSDPSQQGQQGQPAPGQQGGQQGQHGQDARDGSSDQHGQNPQGGEQDAGAGQGSGQDPAQPGQRDDARGSAAGNADPQRTQPDPRTAAGDPAQQQQADEEQRQRMQQAMQQAQEAGEEENGRAVRSDGRTPQQREQQQALEAWMRRVPDEPGELLRAKFELENERRTRERQWFEQ